MKRACLAVVLAAACLSACGARIPAVSPLQQLQSNGSGLLQVDAAARRVSSDEAALVKATARDEVARTRHLAAVLHRDARLLMRATGGNGARLRRLEPRMPNRWARSYVANLITALTWQWAEAQSLQRISTLVSADTCLCRGNDAHRLHHLSLNVQWRAWQSVLATKHAQHILHTHPGAFRYTPVTPAAAGQ